MKIVTLTLSPAFDRFCNTKALVSYRENLLYETSYSAGGKGVNISRALHKAGIPSEAVVLLGKMNGDAFIKELSSEGLDLHSVWQEGRVRENITIQDFRFETRLAFPAPVGTKDKIDEIMLSLNSLESGDILTLTGRLPQGIEAKDVMPYLLEFKRKGVLLVIDSKSFHIRDLEEIRPWLIKPNKEEMAQYYAAHGSDTRAKALVAARHLHHYRGIANVMVSIGPRGAVLYNDDGAFAFKAPHLKEVRSTVGAGDSAIAGFIAAHYKGLDSESKLRYAIGFGTAACLKEGVQAPDVDTALDIAAKLKFDEIELPTPIWLEDA